MIAGLAVAESSLIGSESGNRARTGVDHKGALDLLAQV